MFSPHKNYTLGNEHVSWLELAILHCICISKSHIVHHKHIQVISTKKLP
jgi:hypothetical protein